MNALKISLSRVLDYVKRSMVHIRALFTSLGRLEIVFRPGISCRVIDEVEADDPLAQDEKPAGLAAERQLWPVVARPVRGKALREH